jgi:hypothetical protein
VIVRGFTVCSWLSALRKNRFCRCRIALGAEQEVDGLARPSTGWMKTVGGQRKTRHRGSADGGLDVHRVG